MTVNTFPSASIAPTTSSRMGKAAVSASGEGFDAMVADVMANDGDKTAPSITKTSTDAPPPKSGAAPVMADTSTDETRDDVGNPEVLNAPTLFVMQPQPSQPTADDTVFTEAVAPHSPSSDQTPLPAAETGVERLETTLPESATFAGASASSAQTASADPIDALPQMLDSESATPAILPKDNAQITTADTMVALPQTRVPDSGASATSTKTSAQDAEARPPIAQLTAAPTADESSAKLVHAALASQAPSIAKTEQAVVRAGNGDADQIPDQAYAAQAATTDLLTDSPARKAGEAFRDVVSNASAGAQKTGVQPAATSDETKAEGSSSTPSGKAQTGPASTGLASTGQASPAVTPSAATSAFAAQVQAQANAIDPGVSATINTAPTAQSQQATPANVIATPVIASFSGLSRATLETTVQIAAQITRQLAGRSTRFEMGLTPEGLGKVNVSMDIDAGGQLTARLAFDNPLAAADLRSRVDELRGQLQDAGFKLADDALTFSHHDASSRNGDADQRPDQNQGRAFAAASRMADDADLLPPVPAWVSLSLTPRGVDMKV